MRVVRTDEGPKNLIRCDLCGGEFQFGPHRYAGRKVVSWDIMICETCDDVNRDGLVPQQHRGLMERLEAAGVTLRTLPGGSIAIPGRGS